MSGRGLLHFSDVILVVSRMDQTACWRNGLWNQAQDAIHFVGPICFIPCDVPHPASALSDALGFPKACFALAQMSPDDSLLLASSEEFENEHRLRQQKDRGNGNVRRVSHPASWLAAR